MAIVLFLGEDVKEYTAERDGLVKRYFDEGRIRCDICAEPMGRHDEYTRGLKEMAVEISIVVARCRKCNRSHALLPDFVLPHKQYSANEVEGVIIDGATLPTIQIETQASESTVRRWISRTGERLKAAVSILKYLFLEMGAAMSEIILEPGGIYGELEQVLGLAPVAVRYSGNRLGLANIWLGRHSRKELI